MAKWPAPARQAYEFVRSSSRLAPTSAGDMPRRIRVHGQDLEGFPDWQSLNQYQSEARLFLLYIIGSLSDRLSRRRYC